MDSKVRRAIAAIGKAGLDPIRYPNAVWDDEVLGLRGAGHQDRIHHVRVQVEVQTPAEQIMCRPRPNAAGQDELFTAWRHHAVF